MESKFLHRIIGLLGPWYKGSSQRREALDRSIRFLELIGRVICLQVLLLFGDKLFPCLRSHEKISS